MQTAGKLATLIVVGLGHIGSHLVSHLARLPEIGRLVLIDPDEYDESNRRGQEIDASDVGRLKTELQADVACRINPELVVTTFAGAVQDVPLGHLSGDLILACLDSRAARQYLNEVARTLGVPWIDAGVEPGSGLARVTVYEPGCDTPCLECAWDQRDYDALPQTYPCRSGGPNSATAAPSGLGALAAALQAIECQKLLSGRPSAAASGAEVVIDSTSHRLYRTVMRRNPLCRLRHTGPLDIVGVASTVRDTTVKQALALGGDGGRDLASARLRVPIHTWAGRLVCGRCDRVTTGPHLRRVNGRPTPSCPGCGGVMTASGFDLLEELGPYRETATELSSTLADLGLCDHDVVGIQRSGEWRYFEVGVPTDEEERR